MVTICRNVLPALRRTVASVLAQQYPALEYWIVDGASTDGTREYLATLGDAGVQFVSEPDAGIADAMNKGAGLATGDWIAHLHADDEYLPGALATVAEAAGDDADVLCGWIIKREVVGETVFHCAPQRLPAEMSINHPATFVRREWFARSGGFETRWRNAMDYELFLRLQRQGARFRVIERPLVRMAYGGQSERSLWRTLVEARDVRRKHQSPWWYRSNLCLLYEYLRGSVRAALQRMGLGGLVRWYRRHFATLPKEPA